ncbi:hypothetical protein Val02_86160 [Virgisporangium aliadipatigenens]|uniref:Uncharacterized protein n=1 Tax=Virgisporangium aliadipatigenens TaxID=741659 RepID=A0A8J4DUX0_9ACTN|nr:hypothetical protein Val02_86160 [Virgisporangium aliadipatigenens]
MTSGARGRYCSGGARHPRGEVPAGWGLAAADKKECLPIHDGPSLREITDGWYPGGCAAWYGPRRPARWPPERAP